MASYHHNIPFLLFSSKSLAWSTVAEERDRAAVTQLSYDNNFTRKLTDFAGPRVNNALISKYSKWPPGLRLPCVQTAWSARHTIEQLTSDLNMRRNPRWIHGLGDSGIAPLWLHASLNFEDWISKRAPGDSTRGSTINDASKQMNRHKYHCCNHFIIYLDRCTNEITIAKLSS